MTDAEALYRRVLLIRRAEEAVMARYRQDGMKTPVHLSVGQEAVAAAVCHALGDGGQCLSSYRSHAAYLAMTLETDRFFAELYGRADGVAKGKAGSMHLSAPGRGFLGSSAVVATPIPVAVGAALANRLKGRPGWVAVFFGDGAVDEGVFAESLNLAVLKRLRVAFVCEDNGLAIHSRDTERHAFGKVGDLARHYGCVVRESESTLASKLHGLAREAMAEGEKADRPVLLHFKCFRYLEHVGIGEDFEAGYRAAAEAEPWKRRDPVAVQRAELLKSMPEAGVRDLEAGIARQLADSVARAEAAPFPAPGELWTDVLA